MPILPEGGTQMSKQSGESLFPDLPNLPRRMEQMFRSLLAPAAGAISQEGVWHPPVDVYETQQALVVKVDLPGMKGQAVDVSIEDNHLFIEGERSGDAEPDPESLFYSERAKGAFHRIIHLPENVDAESTEAKYEDGVLTVTMPKAGREGGRRIEIT